MRKQLFRTALFALTLVAMASCGKKYIYESVEGDPLNARIYTLDNGLKVYLTVNKEAPRIQAYIPVRVGGKNDPAETTGLSHYLEHLMFKGTIHFGTQNYEAEEPLLQQITDLYEVYRTKTDPEERKAIYHQIDSISYEASKIAIPNEYDKLMAAIGAEGTNAYTSYDVTCYTEDIPSNQVENWAKVQSDRFKNMVIRGFHTELETVYEEKNIGMADDQDKTIDALFAELFHNHPYGKQSILGTQEHLKNPSIINIQNHFSNWYRPNNMAICMSGDFAPEKVIRIIDKYFGDMEPNPDLKYLECEPEAEITSPAETSVVGQEAENLWMAWRMPGACDTQNAVIIDLIGDILYNGKAGLIDLDLVQQQKVLEAVCSPYLLADQTAFMFIGYPKEGQTLEEVRDLFLAEVAKVREGDFDDSLIPAIVANKKLAQQRQLENNRARADQFVDAFVNGTEWADAVSYFDRMAAITKDDIVAFANQYLKPESYAAVFKRQGIDPDIKKIDKPVITPIFTNRDTASTFLTEVQHSTVKPIEPVFVDFGKELEKGTVATLDALYKKNDVNDIFTVQYIWETGYYANPVLPDAASYADYLGTSDMTVAQLKQAFYNIACNASFRVSDKRTTLTVNGLSEYMPQALALAEKMLRDLQPDENVLQSYKADVLQSRMVNKTSQRASYNYLLNYALYGPESPATRELSNAEVMALSGDSLTAIIRNLGGMEHRVTYYGPMASADAFTAIAAAHAADDALAPVPAAVDATYLPTEQNVVYIAPYVANNIILGSVSRGAQGFDLEHHAANILFNEYFGGGMNGIVFQEMREARGLAYSASAIDREPSEKDQYELYQTFIMTQNDKMIDALTHFAEITNNMPVSEAAFNIAKEGLLAGLRTERYTGQRVLGYWQRLQDLGLDSDIREKVFNEVQGMTLDDVVAYQQQNIKGRTYSTCVLGNEAELDMDSLANWGTIVRLTTEQIFGY